MRQVSAGNSKLWRLGRVGVWVQDAQDRLHGEEGGPRQAWELLVFLWFLLRRVQHGICFSPRTPELHWLLVCDHRIQQVPHSKSPTDKRGPCQVQSVRKSNKYSLGTHEHNQLYISALLLASWHPGLEIKMLPSVLYTVKYTKAQPLVEDAHTWQWTPDMRSNLWWNTRMHACILERSQLEGSYIGGLLHSLYPQEFTVTQTSTPDIPWGTVG